MKDKKIGEIFQTDNTQKFRHLLHNRELEDRVQKVKRSIAKNGWVQQPIIVNEKYEVVDGQARLQACKDMGIGITYAVIPGLGIKECRIINSISSNWRYSDYIDSFADEGKIDFKYLDQLTEKLKSITGMSKNTTLLRMLMDDSSIEKKIVDGTVFCDERLYNIASDGIEYLSNFVSILKAADMKTTSMMEALLYANKFLDEDQKGMLIKAFKNRCTKDLYPVKPTSFMHALTIIDKIYNYKKKSGNKISLSSIAETEGKFPNANL